MVKVNAALSRLPTFTAAGSVEPHRAMVTVTHGLDAAQESFEAAKRGEPRVVLGRALLPDRVRPERRAARALT